MLEVFGDATGNTRRVTVAIEESGLPYEPRLVALARGENRMPAYLAMNATGRVPTLVDSEGPGGARLVLTQSNAIMMYVAEKSGRLLSTSADPSRYVVFEWLFFFLTDVIAPSHQAFFARRGPGGAQMEEMAGAMDARALEMLEHVERQLKRAEFVAGAEFSLADVAGFTIASAYTEKLAWGSFPNMRRWFRTVGERPAVARGMSAFT